MGDVSAMTLAVELNGDQLVYHRNPGALTRLNLAGLEAVDVVVAGDTCYWHLTAHDRQEAVVPIGIPGESLIRQYLSDWRGFDYDGLVRFVSEPPARGRKRLWPLA